MTSTREIRQFEFDNKLPRCRIVALTGLASASARLEALSSGVDHFMTKPVDFKALQSLLNEASESKRKSSLSQMSMGAEEVEEHVQGIQAKRPENIHEDPQQKAQEVEEPAQVAHVEQKENMQEGSHQRAEGVEEPAHETEIEQPEHIQEDPQQGTKNVDESVQVEQVEQTEQLEHTQEGSQQGAERAEKMQIEQKEHIQEGSQQEASITEQQQHGGEGIRPQQEVVKGSSEET
jgi:YesN/AraC family two-component response regulator